MKVFIIVPAYNEAKIIGHVITEMRRLYDGIVVVDDASNDATAHEARGAGADVLRHFINRGQGAALKTGIVYALANDADIIVTFDADGQHRIEDIEKLIKPVAEGTADVVLGSRFLGDAFGMSATRRIILRGGVLFTRLFSHIHVTDTHNGLRAFSRDAALKIRITQDRMAHASEILDEIVRHRLRYVEVPVMVHYTEYSRRKGQSGLAMFKIAFKFLISKFMQ